MEPTFNVKNRPLKRLLSALQCRTTGGGGGSRCGRRRRHNDTAERRGFDATHGERHGHSPAPKAAGARGSLLEARESSFDS